MEDGGRLESDDAIFPGPLAGVEGCEKVWLGRQVEDPEKAALIVRTYRGPIIHVLRPYRTGWESFTLLLTRKW
jgi:hypothetical protein